MSGPFPAKYDAVSVERGWYNFWRDRGLFSPDQRDADADSPVFSLVLPPPNVTGSLHLGHALTAALQDALVRWRRMRGERTVWVPGSDHAGIATQAAVERALLAEGRSREEVGREAFLEAVWEWRRRKGERIFSQLERMGASLDWQRTCFTMSEVCGTVVTDHMSPPPGGNCPNCNIVNIFLSWLVFFFQVSYEGCERGICVTPRPRLDLPGRQRGELVLSVGLSHLRH